MTTNQKIEFIEQWLCETYPGDGVGVAQTHLSEFNPYCFTPSGGFENNIRFDLYIERSRLKPLKTKSRIIEFMETEVAIYMVTK